MRDTEKPSIFFDLQEKEKKNTRVMLDNGTVNYLVPAQNLMQYSCKDAK